MEAASRREFLASGAAIAVPAAVAEMTAPEAVSRDGLLADKTAVIYGAAGAIGTSVAHAFAREGARLYLAGRRLEPVESLARELNQAGGQAIAARVDARDRDAVEEHVSEVVRHAGRIDISFNLISLGDEQGQRLTAMSREAFDLPISNAMRSHFLTATAAARHMEARGSGVILALTANVARKPYVASGGFGVACAAIEALCRQLAIESGPRGVRVVALRSAGSPDSPGVSAAIREHAYTAGVTRDAFEARIADKTMLKRMPRMAEIASAAVLAASDRASAITAAVLNVTCGEIAD